SPQSDPSAPHGGERRHADRENCDDEPPRLAVRSVVGPRVRIPGPLRLDYRTGFTQPRPDRFTGGLHWTGLVHLVSDYPTGPVRYTSRLTRTGPVRYTSRGPRTGPVRYTRPGSRPDQTTRLSPSLDPVHRTSTRAAHACLRHHTGPVHHAHPLGPVCRSTRPPHSLRASTRPTGPVFGPLMLACATTPDRSTTPSTSDWSAGPPVHPSTQGSGSRRSSDGTSPSTRTSPAWAASTPTAASWSGLVDCSPRAAPSDRTAPPDWTTGPDEEADRTASDPDCWTGPPDWTASLDRPRPDEETDRSTPSAFRTGPP